MNVDDRGPVALTHIDTLVRAAMRFPGQRQRLLRQALRLAQQALARNVDNRLAIRWLGVIWWQLGERRRGQALLYCGKRRASCSRVS